jgi:hypothetical protein
VTDWITSLDTFLSYKYTHVLQGGKEIIVVVAETDSTVSSSTTAAATSFSLAPKGGFTFKLPEGKFFRASPMRPLIIYS